MGKKRERKKEKQRARQRMRKDYQEKNALTAQDPSDASGSHLTASKRPLGVGAPKTREEGSAVTLEAAVSAPKGLDIYWQLASVRREDREAAAAALLRELSDPLSHAQPPQGGDSEEGPSAEEEEDTSAPKEGGAFGGCPPAVRYAVSRLIKGLASSRGVRPFFEP